MKNRAFPNLLCLLPLLAAGAACAEGDSGQYFFGLRAAGSDGKAIRFGYESAQGSRGAVQYVEQAGDAPGFAGPSAGPGLSGRSLVINGLWDFKLGATGITPFAGASLGRTDLRAAPGIDADGGDRAWGMQLMVGLGYKLTPSVGLHLDLRHQRSIGSPGLPFSFCSPLRNALCAMPAAGAAAPNQAIISNRLGVGLDWSF